MATNFKKPMLLLPVLLISAIGVAVFISSLATQTIGASRNPWPAFEMVYTDLGSKRGPNDTPGYTIVRLSYYNTREWRSEVLEDSVNPAATGSYSEFKGDQLTGFNAQFNDTETTKLSPTEGLYAPADWLFPGRIEAFQTRFGGHLTATMSPGILSYTFIEKVPCDAQVNKCHAPSSQVTTEIKVNKDTLVPIEMIIKSDGVPTRQVTVSRFQLLE